MLRVIYAECHLCCVIYAECHLCWVSFMLSVIYAECHFMLSVTNRPFMPKCHCVKCRYAQCRYVQYRGVLSLVKVWNFDIVRPQPRTTAVLYVDVRLEASNHHSSVASWVWTGGENIWRNSVGRRQPFSPIACCTIRCSTPVGPGQETRLTLVRRFGVERKKIKYCDHVGIWWQLWL